MVSIRQDGDNHHAGATSAGKNELRCCRSASCGPWRAIVASFLGGLLWCALTPVWSEDAATKVQEGNIDQWIEYYQRMRETQKPVSREVTTKGNPAPAGTESGDARDASDSQGK